MVNINLISILQVVAITIIWSAIYKYFMQVSIGDAIVVTCGKFGSSRSIIWKIVIVLAMLFVPVQVIVNYVFVASFGFSIGIMIYWFAKNSTQKNKHIGNRVKGEFLNEKV